SLLIIKEFFSDLEQKWGVLGGFGGKSCELGLKPWQKQEWCIPEVSADYVAAMEDVLDLYEEPYDPLRPVVCFDESPKQLIAEIRTPLSAKPGVPARYDT
ncbi:hypothetical protein SAMN05421881_10601, partial [Nitrosomonas halophila]